MHHICETHSFAIIISFSDISSSKSQKILSFTSLPEKIEYQSNIQTETHYKNYLLYSLGEYPNFFLKLFEKAATDEKPHFSAVSLIDAPWDIRLMAMSNL